MDRRRAAGSRLLAVAAVLLLLAAAASARTLKAQPGNPGQGNQRENCGSIFTGI